MRLPLHPLVSLWMVLATSGCGEDGAADHRDPTAVEPTQAQGEAALETAPDPRCRSKGQAFEELEWLSESRFALLVAPRDEQLGPTMAALSAGELGRELPVYARFELRNLAIELRALALVYEPLGLTPEQMLKVHGAKNEPIWFLPAPCDHAALEARASARWNVDFRGDGNARVGIAPADAALPFDLILLPGARIALVPRGGSAAVQRWLAGTVAPTSLTDPPAQEATVSPGRELSGLDAAPLRLRLRGRALGAESPEEAGAPRLLSLRSPA